MSKQFEGVVVAKARNGKGIAFNVDGEDIWYNAQDEDQIPQDVAKGDLVAFSYDTTRKGGRTFSNIKGDVEILEKGDGGGSSRGGSGGGSGRSGGSRGGYSGRSGGGGRTSGGASGGGATDKDRQIVRQNALTQANKLVETIVGAALADSSVELPELTPAFVIDLAKEFESYVFS